MMAFAKSRGHFFTVANLRTENFRVAKLARNHKHGSMDLKRAISQFSLLGLLACGFFSLTSCGMISGKGKKKTADDEKPVTGMEAYQRAGGRIAGVGGLGSGGASATATVRPTAMGITPDADPENVQLMIDTVRNGG
mgnify:CR=1 FL=1